MTQADLASRTGRPLKTINEIVKGKTAITPETALQFERVLGVPASFWMNLERNYREALARQREREQLSAQQDWLKGFPLTAMAKLGWLQLFADPVRQLQELLGFFGVASPREWEALWAAPDVAYRKSAAFASDPRAVAAWLRRGELIARETLCRPYDAARFREALQTVRALTRDPPNRFQPELVRTCAEAGVGVAFVPELPGVRVSGATRWLTPSKALLQLSLRYKTDDHLWFSFFHEAGHILRHGKTEVFVDDGQTEGKKEAEANEFANNTLVPPATLRRLRAAPPRSNEGIERTAEELGIAPGILVGRLQHEGLLPRTHCNGLKVRLVWGKA
ncbi:MAG: helix-turn-helix domain-containing protein [Deltaproteobacteria bacterium]|nr:helix-turn-helix domain-containing protein [Deltaproteobacteria bacterium]